MGEHHASARPRHLAFCLSTLPLRFPYRLGSPVVPFYPFSFWVPLLEPNSRKKGTLIIKGLLGNLAGLLKGFYKGSMGV